MILSQQVIDDIRKASEILGRPVCFLDFEYNRSSHKLLNLVSCSFVHSQRPNEIIEVWLLNNPDNSEFLQTTFSEMAADGAVFVAYNVAAEGRSFLSLKLDPNKVTWIDLYADWRQLTFNNNSCQYGTYYSKTGYKRFSRPPSVIKEKNKGVDNNAVGKGLVDCVAQMFKIFIDGNRKRAMRDLILEDRPEYTPEEQKEIMEYCSDDVVYLPQVFNEIHKRLCRAIPIDPAIVLRAQYRRGDFMASIAKMEKVGFPVNIDKIRALRHNFESAKDTILTDLVENHYPFYIREQKNARQLIGEWTEKYDKFVEFIKSKNAFDTWPRTKNKETGKSTDTLSRDEKTLEKYDGIPEIYAYRQAKKLIKQLAWFKEPDAKKRKEEGDFFDAIGPDNFLRTFLGAYGTQTSRNAPKASRFILAMSAWLRCLIEPPPGYVVIAIDYASQEFGIAAVKSGDKSMIAAYLSGDPYLYFAKQAGAVPQDANPKWCKNPKLAPEDQREKYTEYKRQRSLFKNTTLGLQYGMGAVSLAARLSADMGETITVEDAKKLINLHRRVYPRYWQWLDEIETNYKRGGFLIAWDGWALLGDLLNILSVKNWPTQTGGGVIMREAVRLCHLCGINIMAPLHDALYSLAKEEEAEEAKEIIAANMKKAFTNVLGDSLEIRLDIDIHRHGEPWIDEKGEKYYNLLNKYLTPMKNREDRNRELLETIYRRD